LTEDGIERCVDDACEQIDSEEALALVARYGFAAAN